LTNTNTASKIIDIYDTQSGLWTVDSLSVGRQFIAGGAIGPKLIFAGGANASGTSGTTLVNIYDTISGVWTNANLSTAVLGASAAVAGNKFLVAGGITSTGMASSTVHVYTLTASGLVEENPKLINVFPNPSTGCFNIEMNQAGRLQILDITGKVVFNRDVDAGEDFIQIDLSQNAKGLYLIKFTDRQYQESLVKVIVE